MKRLTLNTTSITVSILMFLFLLFCFYLLPCYALTYSTTLANGTLADADEVMGDFNDAKTEIENLPGSQITDNTISNSKISTSAQIDTTKIEGSTTDVNLQAFNSNVRNGCRIVYEAVGNITVTVGEVMINGKYRRITTAVDSAWTAASTTASGLDTSTEGASTWYEVYLCADDPNASTFTVVLSTNASAPVYTGATNYRRVGRIYNSAGSNIEAVVNLGANGLHIAEGRGVGTGSAVTFTVGFQPIHVKIIKGDADPATGEDPVIYESTRMLNVDGLEFYQNAVSSADFQTAAVITNYTTVSVDINITNTNIFYWYMEGY